MHIGWKRDDDEGLFRKIVLINFILVLFVETPRKFITAKLSIRKPGSSSVLIFYFEATRGYVIYSPRRAAPR